MLVAATSAALLIALLHRCVLLKCFSKSDRQLPKRRFSIGRCAIASRIWVLLHCCTLLGDGTSCRAQFFVIICRALQWGVESRPTFIHLWIHPSAQQNWQQYLAKTRASYRLTTPFVRLGAEYVWWVWPSLILGQSGSMFFSEVGEQEARSGECFVLLRSCGVRLLNGV